MQARADIVALDMVRLADGRTEDQITGADTSGGSTPALYAAYIQDTADRNQVEVSKLVIEWGDWDGTAFTPTVGNDVPTAVQVVASETTDYFFLRGSGNVSRTAVATTDDVATFSLGSKLATAKLGNATLINGVITGLLCGAPTNPPPPASACPNQADVSAGGYDGMATHDVDLDDLRSAGGFGSVDELMDHEFTAEEFARTSGQAFRNNGDPSTAEAYDGDDNSLAEASAGASGTFTMRDVMEVQSPADGATAEADVNPFDVFMAGIQVANGDNFVDMPLTVPPTSLPVGISNLTMSSRYKVIEAPQLGFGRVGSVGATDIHTAQLQVFYTLTFDVNLTVAGTGVSGTFSVPVDIAGGGATGTLTDIACTQPESDATIDVVTAPRAFVGTIGKAFSPSSPITVGNVNLTVGGIPAGSVGISVYGAVGPTSQNTNATNMPQIAIDETRTAAGSSLALGGAITSVQLQTALPVTTMNTQLASTLNGLLTLVDAAASPVLGVLGTSISSADVVNIGVDCHAVRLAA